MPLLLRLQVAAQAVAACWLVTALLLQSQPRGWQLQSCLVPGTA
jgi:hypothetical protein